MKKALKFLAYPFVTLLVIAVNVASFFLSVEVSVSFMRTISLILYIFLGGMVLNKIKDKKIKTYSLIFTALLMLAGAIACIIAIDALGDNGVWAGMILFPLSATAVYLLGDYISITAIRVTALIISAVLPVLISFTASKIFGLKKKKLKIALIIIMALICIGSVIRSAVEIYNIYSDNFYNEYNGQLYNAYYDVNGEKYMSNEAVPYYDRNGKVYYQTYNHPEKENSDQYLLYVGEMTDENGNEYDINDFYVYADGYIFMDENSTVTMRDDLPEDVTTDWIWMDSEGNICALVSGVSYTPSGEPYFGMGNEYKTR
ncbi:MAG: hypothetical protein K2J55_00885 [Eubacterium sp.]|nr:hypothetical protein [Eubacterium sp.]